MLNYKSIRTLFFILSIVFSHTLLAQNETAFWFFGENAGLNFNSGFPSAALNSQIFTTEGCSTISNKQGQLLFYSDGITVWNRNHQIMLNGTGLNGDDSSTQSAIIIPQPGSNSIYFIFTVDARAGEFGLQYSIIDITLDGGLGGVTNTKNVSLATPTTEKITAVESADGESIWVIGHGWGNNEFLAYLVSDTGLNTTPVISSVGSVHGGNTNSSIGYLKASPNREKVACAKSHGNEVQLFDFNATTGELTNPITISNYATNTVGPYGCEFSPDSRLLYISEIIDYNNVQETSKIHQYNITLPTQAQILNSDIIIAEEDGQLGAIQQALDGKLYIAKFGQSSICVINDPNEIGTTANYESETIFLGGETSRLGLPPFIQSYFFATNVFNNTCFGDSTEFSIDTSTTIDSITWNFGDPASGANNTSNNLSPTHVFSAPGTYNITISIVAEGENQLVLRTLTISGQPPVMDLDDLTTCQSNDNATTDLTSVIPNNILNDTNFILSFYENELDATNRQNGIVSPSFYPTPQTNQTIYVRLENVGGSDCFSISNFEIILNTPPDIEPVENVFFCEDINTNNSNITIDVGDLPLPINNYAFLWLESNEITPQIIVDEPGTYTVRITETNTITSNKPEGCYADRIVNVDSSSIATIDHISTTGNSATIYVSGLGDYEYTLDNENGVYQDSNIFENLEPGIHVVYVNDKNSCGVVQKSFSIIDFPIYFTPNGDQVNDYWQVKGVSSEFQSNSKIYIFDRYGKLITQIKASSRGWDGTLNGQPLPNSDYWFSVTLDDGRVFMNHFTLKR